MTEQETWKDVPGYGGHYQASSLGRVRVKARIVKKAHRSGGVSTQHYPERILAGHLNRDGYRILHLCVENVRHVVGAHRIVALAFHGAPKPGQECCHCNGVPDDNRPANLRWDTHLNNNRDRIRHGTYLAGSRHPMSKFDEALRARIRRHEIGLAEAMECGVSRTHYYRIRRAADEGREMGSLK